MTRTIPGRQRSGAWWIAALAGLFATYFHFTDASPTSREAVAGQASVAAPSASTPDDLLAAIDLTSPLVRPGQVGPYTVALDRLEAKCTEPREQIADIAVRGAEALRDDHGVSESVLGVL